MARLIFYPVGNADSTLLHLTDGRVILKDYFKCEPEGEHDKRIRLDEELRTYLDEHGLSEFDVVAFSHADDDHIHGAENFFWFEHAKKYQGSDRVKIRELFVPACFITETGLENSAGIICEEAKYRLKRGVGIRVFGNPEPLVEWFKSQSIDPTTRLDLITKAGECVPGFNRSRGQVEIFSHSPFSFRMEGEDIDRNCNSLVWHLTFYEFDREFRCMLGADAEYETWENIGYISKKYGNQMRLDWDLFRISHHCSYTALASEKGKEVTVPTSAVAALFERGSENCLLISSSYPIPDCDTEQPPHRQAAGYYRQVARNHGSADNFVVTMEWPPSSDLPKPVVVETSKYGFVLRKRLAASRGAATIIRTPSPRLG